ncbi:hypothetical protein ABZ738_22600 [Micromonospora sp. NPDC047793]|uniref:hypothetical protein n=1 Tax=Micromonospora sp. NPDC047793 TaxID=3154342 RepID=UPI0033EECB19
MSTHEVREQASGVNGDRTIERVAVHVGNSMRTIRETFRAYLARVPQLHHLSHYTQTDWDFSIGAPSRTDHAVMGSNLVAALTRLNDLLTPVGTGALIRVVTHCDGGAVLCNTIMQGERAVGVALDPSSRHSLRDEPTRQADMAVAELVTELRAGFGQRSQDPGGFQNAELDNSLRWVPPEIHGDLDARIRAVLDPLDLQYVAVLHEGRLIVVNDVFDEGATEVFFRAGHTPAGRRDFYARFLPTLQQHSLDIGGIVNATIGRNMRRLVLDVQRGAICAYRVDPRTTLVGITLNQDQVALTDIKTEWLSRTPHPDAG